ncbi:hypothetical protein [Catelliglobosispora koreensis]|uniref:hypothetical protein n=1 Tax=Catelliglobosispora koreensis TaxID=129052 RepID=UPI00037F9A66|nr:hypothetical protein [Catelliglobosispora koreensis]
MTRATNVPLSATTARMFHVRLLIAPLSAALLALSACGSDPVPAATPAPSASAQGVPAEATQPRSKLAARAAAAKDLRQVAFYVLKTKDRPDRTVAITRATDGSWRVDIPKSAHGGTIDIAIVFHQNALYQCALPGNCVKVDGQLPGTSDPKISHLITDWLAVMLDRQQAIAVSIAQPLPGAAGECYAIESSAVALPMPLDAGIYCYEKDGTLTAARLSIGTLVLAGQPGPPPPTVTLPGPVVPGAPLPLAAPAPTASSTPVP